MQRTRVNSSNLAEVGFNSEVGVLEILFHSGHTYQYLGVPEATYRALMAAPSKGMYFDQFVKYIFRTIQLN